MIFHACPFDFQIDQKLIKIFDLFDDVVKLETKSDFSLNLEKINDKYLKYLSFIVCTMEKLQNYCLIFQNSYNNFDKCKIQKVLFLSMLDNFDKIFNRLLNIKYDSTSTIQDYNFHLFWLIVDKKNQNYCDWKEFNELLFFYYQFDLGSLFLIRNLLIWNSSEINNTISIFQYEQFIAFVGSWKSFPEVIKKLSENCKFHGSELAPLHYRKKTFSLKNSSVDNLYTINYTTDYDDKFYAIRIRHGLDDNEYYIYDEKKPIERYKNL
jgi:hypothetical protein